MFRHSYCHSELDSESHTKPRVTATKDESMGAKARYLTYHVAPQLSFRALTRNLLISLHFEAGAKSVDVITVLIVVTFFGSRVCPYPHFCFIMRFRVGARNDSSKAGVIVR